MCHSTGIWICFYFLSAAVTVIIEIHRKLVYILEHLEEAALEKIQKLVFFHFF